MTQDPVTGVILAGGQSRRFGSDKALFEIDGVPMIQRAYDTLSQVASPVYVSVASEHIHYEIPASHLFDVPGYAGPLAGIHAALQASPSPWVLVLAVDLPFVTPVHLRLLLEARSHQSEAVIAYTEDRTHPLCACYHTRSLPVAEELLNQEAFKVLTFVRRLNVHKVAFHPSVLTNMNTPLQFPPTE